MKKSRLIILQIFFSAVAVALLFAPGLVQSDAIAARKDCGVETDSGKRLKCRTENLNDAVDSLVTTALIDNTGAFTENQKKQLENVKNRGRSESERIKPEDFKQLAKKRKVDCYIQEIVGDVDPANDDNSNGECDGTENCIGNEDGICDNEEQKMGGCAEVLDDGIGNDNGVCETKGRYKEVCIEICDTDTIMSEGDETNVEPGKAAEIDQALLNATDIVDESQNTVESYLNARVLEVQAFAVCDKETMLPCEYLHCLLEKDRTSTSKTIEDLAIATVSLQAVADACRDAGDQTIPIPFVGGSIDVRAVCIPLGLAANGVAIISQLLEVTDDSESADRLDATALCAQDTGGQVEEVNTLVNEVLGLLVQPQGQREGFPVK